METEFQTSFIPKKPLSEDRTPSTKPVSLLIFVSTVIFFASIAGAGIMYFYKVSLAKSVESKKSDLLTAKEAFEGNFITEIQNFDRRLTAANQILANHILVSPIFDALAQATLKSIQFTKFTHSVKGSGPSAQIQVQLEGRVDNYTDLAYAHLALESDALTQNKYIKDPVFSNITLDEQTGSVLFNLTFTIDPSYILYTDTLKRAEDTTGPETDPEIQTPPAPPTEATTGEDQNIIQ